MKSKGLGDTLGKLFEAIGVAWLVKQWSRITGKSCNCKTRQQLMNERFPYGRNGR